jgi:glycine/D-amino acid oxidase-like deaminating enzyme
LQPDVIIIGGGIAGAATALYLARDGVAVRLIEAGVIGGAASGANAGSLHAQIPHDPFQRLGADWARGFQPAVRLFIASLAMWRNLEADLGVDLEIGFGGGVLIAANDREMAEIAAKAATERAAGLDVELLDRAAIRARAPYLADSCIGGAFCASEGKANPLLVAPALAAAARAAGVEIVTGAGPVQISASGTGYAVAAGAATHHARRLVIAAGAQTGVLAAQLQAPLAIEAFPIQVSVTEPTDAFVPHLVYCAGAKLTLKQSRHGSLLIGGGWDARLDSRGRPMVDPVNLAANMQVAASVVPRVKALQLVRSWAAFVNGTADWLPILGELPGSPGVFVNYVPWMGFTGGPAGARIVADLVQGRGNSLDIPIAAFRPGGVNAG